jgi:hypothetical protein
MRSPERSIRTEGQRHETAHREEAAHVSREENGLGHPHPGLETRSYGTSTTSPPAYVARFCMMMVLVLYEIKRTEPSPIVKLEPPM